MAALLYVNPTDDTADATPAEAFGTPSPDRLAVRFVLNDESPDARLYVGVSSGMTTTTGVLARVGPGQAVTVECGPSQDLFYRTDGSNRAITMWEVTGV
ncbi:MAG: hypothetical protein KIS66_13895 [Fimbriimonadaceae bacterium]|nr:hypothetical protein [Fimbriimonadaceae bacterium]